MTKRLSLRFLFLVLCLTVVVVIFGSGFNAYAFGNVGYGCTSARVIATVDQSAASTLTTNACDSLKWSGKVYKTSGTYLDTIPTVKGSDSIMILNLTVNHPSASTQTIKACEGYPWNGTVYIVSGIYHDTISNKSGCDSLMTLNLTVNHSSTSLQTTSSCDAYAWRGKTYTASGIYKDTIPNKTGCDSLMVLNLIITNVNAAIKVNNITITADSTADSYQWILCSNNNSSILGAIGQSYVATGSGSYAVVETKNGCIDTSNCVPTIITGIAASEKNTVRFYPNPGKGLYTLNLPEQAEIKIMSLTGAIIFDERLSKGDHIIDLLNITNGVYMMQVHTNETVTALKLIKQD